ncbi:MAG TPA: GldG family protein [Polyangiaceae bacterium]|nr:GldG family protein [Polyangiaceae bacterium]
MNKPSKSGASASTRGGVSRSFRAFAALSVLGAALLAVNSNVLVARWYKRWDLTAERLYTLSPATLKTLHALDQPLQVTVLLGRADPLSVSVRQMLVQYRAETSKLTSRFVDPDQNPAEFQVLQKDLGLLTGRAEDGRLVTDAALVITRGERHWFITTDELVHYDDQSGKARPRLEQALTEGIVNVLGETKAKACFASGHRELSIDDVGPEGLAEVRHRLEKSNFDVVAVDLAAPAAKLADCSVLVVAGPSVAVDDAASARMVDFIKGGGSAFVLSAPLLGEDKRVQRSGLEPIAKLIGVEFGQDFILETDTALRLPRGAGEVFFATPQAHEVTRGLEREGVKIDSRVLVSGAQSLRILANSPAKPLLTSSDRALSVRDLSGLLDPNHKHDPIEQATRAAFTLAVAAELPKPAGGAAKHGPRVVIAGAANLLWGRNYNDSSLYGDRLFSENALSWLSSRPALVSVPEKAEHDIGLSLSEGTLGEVLRYVLIYMPGCSAALGTFVLMRRRSFEKKSRQDEAA